MVTTPFALHQVTRYGQDGLAAIACFACLWPAVFGARPIQVVLVRSPDAPDSFDLALVSTDLAATPVELVSRYAARWQVEVCFRSARQDAGVGQARNRTRRAVQRTVPFGLVCYSLAIVWYARSGHHPAEVAARRALVPDQGRSIGGRHAGNTPPSAAGRAIPPRSGHRADPAGNPPGAGSLGRRRDLKCETPVT
jgi:hypothetical protein